MTQVKQLLHFKAHLPKKPYYSDNLEFGLKIAKAETALKSAYIQPNGATHQHSLIFDLDYGNSVLAWDYQNAPTPNIVVENLANGHSHYIYHLETPIRTAINAKPHPIRYGSAIWSALNQKLNGDTNYVHLITKNPFSPQWRTTVFDEHLYTLNELDDWLDLKAANDDLSEEKVVLGRHCHVFEKVAQWAYKAIRQGYPAYDRWYEAVLERVEATNRQIFPHNPIPFSHVRATAKSIAKWTHRNITEASFSQWQAVQGRKGGLAGLKENKAKAGAIGGLNGTVESKAKAGAIGGVKSKGGGRPSIGEPWKELGISRATYFRRKANEAFK